MNNLMNYIIELNLVFTILYVTYRIVFHRDRNFVTRRFFLLAILAISISIPLTPSLSISSINGAIPMFSLEGVTVPGQGIPSDPSVQLNLLIFLKIVYSTVVIVGLVRLSLQFIRILSAINSSEKNYINGHLVLSSRLMHASSFFRYIFIDLQNNRENALDHILDHEIIHKTEWHSADRILTEVFVLLCWFNPFAWFYRRSVIENHEYLADSGVITHGANVVKYQMSILNQYIESASITNQFSSHIKKRIKMINTSYKMGSKWKAAILLPVSIFAFFLISCGEQKENELAIDQLNTSASLDEEVFFVVEDMPTFNGEEPGQFRKYIAQNVRYPKEAAEHGVGGKVFIKFVVNSEGKVIIPDEELLSKIEGKPIDEVVVVTYRTINEDAAEPDEKYIQLLKEEAIRVVSGSPDWEPGKQRGKEVSVAFTFPIVFALQ